MPASRDTVPLTPEQQAILFDSLNDGEGAYAVQLRCALDPFEPAAFQRAWDRVADRHAALRLRVRWSGRRQPVQTVVADPPKAVRTTSVYGHRGDLRELAFRIFDEEFARPVELEADRLVTPSVVADGQRAYAAWTTHHLVLDGQSSRLMLAEVAEEYDRALAGVSEQRPPAASFADFVRWRLARPGPPAQRAGEDADPGRELLRALGATPSPGAHQRVLRPFPDGLTGRMRWHARRAGVTVASQFHAAMALAMGRLAGLSSVRIGTTSYGRPPELPGSADMLGMFTVTRGVPVELPAEPACGSWAAAFQRDLVGVWDGHLPGAPLGQVPIVVVSHQQATDVFRGERSGVRLEILDVVDATPHPIVATVFIADPALVVLNVNGVALPSWAPDHLADEVFRQLAAIVQAQ